MSKHAVNNLVSIVTGTITATGIGMWLFQALGVLVLALIGAFGGWLFTEYIKPAIKPKFDKLFKKKRR